MIKKDIPVPADKARVYLQRGRVAWSSNDFEPFCYFRMRQPLPVAQAVSPGTLRIEYVSLNETDVAREIPVRFAGLSVMGGGGYRTPIAHQFRIGLKSDDQPDVRLLVCSGAFDMPQTAKPIRLPEMREALGAYAEIRVSAATPAGQ